jgi:hypothetical protein
MSDKAADRYWDSEKQQWVWPDTEAGDPWSIPIGELPAGWRFSQCVQSWVGDSFYIVLTGPTKPWPMRTVSARGPTLRAAFQRACLEAARP